MFTTFVPVLDCTEIFRGKLTGTPTTSPETVGDGALISAKFRGLKRGWSLCVSTGITMVSISFLDDERKDELAEPGDMLEVPEDAGTRFMTVGNDLDDDKDVTVRTDGVRLLMSNTDLVGRTVLGADPNVLEFAVVNDWDNVCDAVGKGVIDESESWIKATWLEDKTGAFRVPFLNCIAWEFLFDVKEELNETSESADEPIFDKGLIDGTGINVWLNLFANN